MTNSFSKFRKYLVIQKSLIVPFLSDPTFIHCDKNQFSLPLQTRPLFAANPSAKTVLTKIPIGPRGESIPPTILKPSGCLDGCCCCEQLEHEGFDVSAFPRYSTIVLIRLFITSCFLRTFANNDVSTKQNETFELEFKN